MSVWLTIPSARPAHEAQACVDRWLAAGYRVAIHRDLDAEPVLCDYLRCGDYHGYARTTNSLIKEVLMMDPECDWVVTGGDDTDPDPNKRADEIAVECCRYFYANVFRQNFPTKNVVYETFGVMQPTGDRFSDGSIDRIAGSPWIGREFCLRSYGGNGPYWDEYRHMFLDEELREVALKLGVYWQRPDLIHLHRHFQRASLAINSGAIGKPIPPHLREANTPAHWSRYQAMYLGRKAQGFPGHAIKEAEVCA